MTTDTHWITNPTKTKLQEVIFELYDIYSLTEVWKDIPTNKMSKELVKELAEKLEEVEEEIHNDR